MVSIELCGGWFARGNVLAPDEKEADWKARVHLNAHTSLFPEDINKMPSDVYELDNETGAMKDGTHWHFADAPRQLKVLSD